MHASIHVYRHIYTYIKFKFLTLKNFYYNQASINLQCPEKLTYLPTTVRILYWNCLCGSFSLMFPSLSPSSLHYQILLIFLDSVQVLLSLIPTAKSNFPLFWSLSITNLVQSWGALPFQVKHFVVAFCSSLWACLLSTTLWMIKRKWHRMYDFSLNPWGLMHKKYLVGSCWKKIKNKWMNVLKRRYGLIL